MAEEKLMFPVGFDLDSGTEQVTRDWAKIQRQIQNSIDSKPLTIKLSTEGLESASKDINSVSAKMQELSKTWNSMEFSNKFDESGKMTQAAKDIVIAYNNASGALQTYGQTLQQIASDAIKQSEAEIRAIEKKREAEAKAIEKATQEAQRKKDVLALEENSINNINAKLREQQAILSSSKQGSAEWTNATNEVNRLTSSLGEAQKSAYALVNAAKEEAKAVEKATQGYKEKVKVLRLTENSISNINAKLALQRQRLNEADMGDKKFKRIADEVKRLNDKLITANARVAKLTTTTSSSQLGATSAIQATNAAYNTQLGYVGRLVTRLGVYSAIFAGFRLIANIRETTAEFELQKVALGAIIQDAQKANMLFSQIKTAAVESPFEIKDLVSYTKQLAAYRIGTDELFETTMRLADVSAGLGISMDRIVLAYGQIRAKGSLMGSELKQLTEAGIPMAELLAEKFTKLKGSVVSAADVMGMISDRAVSFKDVKGIFDDMTSAGGMFYQMQAKQAKTLAGEWSNLKDAISIAYDEMGRDVSGGMSTTIGIMKSLIANWRDIAALAVSVSAAIVVYTVVMKNASIAAAALAKSEAISAAVRNRNIALMPKWIAAIIGETRVKGINTVVTRASTVAQIKAAMATNLLSKSFWKLTASMLSNPYVFAIAAIAGLITWILIADNASKRLNKELNKISSESAVKVDALSRNFKRLADEALNAAQGSEKQKNALNELSRTYGDIIPYQNLTIDGLKKMEGNYNSVTTAIYNKIKAQSIENGITAIQEEYTPKIETAENKLKDSIKKIKEFSVITENEMNAVKESFASAINDGFIKPTDTAEENMLKLIDIISNKTGIDVSRIKKDIQQYIKYMEEHNKLIQSNYDSLSKEEINRVNYLYTLRLIQYTTYRNLSFVSKGYASVLSNLQKEEEKLWGGKDYISKGLEELEKGFKETTNKYKAISDELGGIKFETEFDYDVAVSANKIERYRKFIEERFKSKGISLSFDDFIKWKDIGVSKRSKEVNDQFEKIYSSSILSEAEDVSKKISALKFTPERQFQVDIFKSIADKSGVSMDKINQYLISNEQSTEEWASSLKKAYDSATSKVNTLQSSYQAFNKAKETGIGVGVVSFVTKEQVLEADNLANTLKMIMDYYSGIFKEKGSGGDGGDNRLSLLKDEISLVETVYKRYQEYLKYMSKEAAKNEIANLFGKDGKVKGTRFELPFSTDDIKKAYKEAQDISKNLPKSEKAVMEFEIKAADIDFDKIKYDLQKQLDDLSSQIENQQKSSKFFEKMLGLTGDHDLSMSLTMSVYGDMGEGLAGKIKEQLTAAFNGIDISEYLKGDKIDYKGLDSLLKMQSTVDKLGTEGAKNATNLIEQGQSNLAQYIESLYSALDGFQTFEDRRNIIEAKGIAERKKMREKSGLNEIELNKLIAASKAKEKAETDKVKVEEFKASDDYALVFQDIDNVATPSIERVMEKLKEFIEANKELDPQQMKALTEEYQKFSDEMTERNPFAAIAQSITEYVAATKEVKTANEEVLASQIALDEATQARIDAESTNTVIGGETVAMSVEYGEALKVETEAKESNAKATKGLGTAQNKQQEANSKMIAGLEGAAGAVNKVKGFMDGLVDTLGITEDSEAGAFFSAMGKALGFVAGAISLVAVGMSIYTAATTVATAATTALMTVLWPLLAIAAAIAIAFAVFTFLSEAKVRKANKEIARQQKLTEALEYSYGRLQKAMENAMGADAIKNYNDQYTNLLAQAEAAEKQAAAERSKGKKEDEAKTQEYLNNARDLKDEAADMMADFSKQIFGFGLKDFAKDITSVWLEAKLSGENTMDALSKKWKEMMREMVANTIMAKAIEAALDPVFKKIDELKDSPSLMNDPNWWADLSNTLSTSMENSDTVLNILYDLLQKAGFNLKDTQTSLKGISKNIAQASEESILGLAAGINTQNYFISGIYNSVNEIKNLMMSGGTGGVDITSIITMQNTYLVQLPNIAQNTANTVAECKAIVIETRRMADNLDRVIKPRGVAGSHVINTQIN